jgi:hypothetical protein
MENKTTEERLQEIKEHPEKHRHHDLHALTACCISNGAIDTMLFEAHERYAPVGKNGGRNCDVISGPCSCGAWH